jgi:hypothetical protein
VCVYGTATDVGIADDERVALGGSEFVEVLLYGILLETIAYGQYLDKFGMKG